MFTNVFNGTLSGSVFRLVSSFTRRGLKRKIMYCSRDKTGHNRMVCLIGKHTLIKYADCDGNAEL